MLKLSQWEECLAPWEEWGLMVKGSPRSFLSQWWDLSLMDKSLMFVAVILRLETAHCNHETFLLKTSTLFANVETQNGFFFRANITPPIEYYYLKGMYTFGNCQRPVLPLGVAQHKHKITNLWKFELNLSWKLRENDERRNTLVGRVCVLSDRNKGLLARKS